jgi:putative spermidine/putrescine transport system substrate-binding protein
MGITNPYQLTQEQFDAAIALLEDAFSHGPSFWDGNTFGDQITDFAADAWVIGTTWGYQVNSLAFEEEAIEAIKPAEGATGWSDTWMISSQSAHPNCMYMWMDWIISPEVNAQVAEWFGEAPSNPEACALTADEGHCDTFHAGDEAYAAQIHYWTTPTAECLDGRDVECTTYPDWTQAWDEVKA